MRSSILRAASPLSLALLITVSLAGCKEPTGTGGGASSGGNSSGGTTSTGGGTRPTATATGNKQSGDTVLVGEFASLTGSTATFGTATHEGIQFAIDEANAAGGVQGKQIKLVTEDDASKPDQATSVVKKLVSSDQVVAVLGEVSSTRSIAGGGVCQEKGVPMITPSSTNPKVTQIGDCIFRVCFTDDFQAAVAAQFAHDQGYKKVALFKDIKNDYSVAFAEQFGKVFKQLGGEIAGEQTYQEGDSDFKAQLNNLKSSSPDAVLVPGYYSEVGTIARQAKEVGLTVPLLGGDGWDSPQLIPGAGKALEGAFFSDHYFSVDLEEAETKNFIKSFKAKYNKDPDALAALGYDAAKVLIEAMKKAKSLNSDDIKKAIAETKDFQGVTGKVTIDANGNARKSALIMQVQGPVFKKFKSYTPEQVGK
jgi:branched-chain amino acid transport system substrate-binding protein